MAITQRHIAAAANVSRSTVAAVMSEAQCGRISPEVRARVMAVADQLGYRPNRYAQIMRNGKSGMIGIIDGAPMQQLSQKKVVALAHKVGQMEYEPIAHEVLWRVGKRSMEEAGKEACQRMFDSRVEGLIIVHGSEIIQEEYIQPFIQSGIPIVAVGYSGKGKVPNLLSDRTRGYQALIRHLLEQGRRRLGLLGPKSESLELGGLETMREFGLKKAAFHYIGGERVQGQADDREFLSGYQSMRRLMEQRPLPDAVVCANDEWALGALAACTEAGISVPEEMALVGHDNLPASRFGSVAMTTVEQPIDELAEMAVEMIVKAIRRKRLPKVEIHLLPGELIIRRSSDPSLKGIEERRVAL